MEEYYYRNLIEKVYRNESEMWDQLEDSNEGFDDFKDLWGILSDPESISPSTFMEAADLCLTSFYGSTQDHKVVWDSIASHYEQALNDPAVTEEFRDAFLAFAETYEENEDPDCAAEFARMMHLAVNAKDAEMANAIANCAFCPDIWTDDAANPEWSVWFAVFFDKDFSEIPHIQKATETIRELYDKLGEVPELERLRILHATF